MILEGNVDSLLISGPKYLNNFHVDVLENLNNHSRSPGDETYLLWWDPVPLVSQ